MSTRFAGWSRSLTKFLDLFGDCFDRKDTRAHLGVYVRGQLSDLPEKSVEPIALDAGVAPRTLQEFLSQHSWDEDRLRDRLHQLVAAEHHGPHTIGIIDETSDPKKGTRRPAFRSSGAAGWARPRTASSPSTWASPVATFTACSTASCSCPRAGTPIATAAARPVSPMPWCTGPSGRSRLELYDRAVGNGLRFDWLTFDEGYGSKPEFLRELAARQQRYVAEVPRSFTGWLDPPRVVTRPLPPQRPGPRPQGPPPGQRQPTGPAGRRTARTSRDSATSLGSGFASRMARRGRWSGNAST